MEHGTPVEQRKTSGTPEHGTPAEQRNNAETRNTTRTTEHCWNYQNTTEQQSTMIEHWWNNETLTTPMK